MKSPPFTAASSADRIRTQRGARGLTQAALANSVSVSRKFFVDLGSGKETVGLGLVLKVLETLGFEEPGRRFIRDRGAEIAREFQQTLQTQDYEYALRLVSEYSADSIELGRPLLDKSPALEDAQYQVALAALTRWIANKTQTPIPRWAADITRSAEPVFLSEKLYPAGEKMKEVIRAETPQELQELNVWIRERSLGTT